MLLRTYYGDLDIKTDSIISASETNGRYMVTIDDGAGLSLIIQVYASTYMQVLEILGLDVF